MVRHMGVTAVLGPMVLLAGSTPAIGAQQRPAADTVWRYRAPADLERLRHCASAELLLTTKNTLIALDATIGTTLWEQSELPSLSWGLFWPCRAATGLSYKKDKIVAFDLVSGRRRWDASALPTFQEIRGYVALETPDLLLLFLRTAASDRSLLALRLSSGERLWQRDDLFLQSPAFAARGGVSDISEYQAFLTDSDTSLIVYASPDGPIRLNTRTGATIWKGAALAGPRVPGVGQYGAMELIDSILVIPRDKGLIALDSRDGRVLWEAANLLPGHATRLVVVPAGLLVRAGRAYVTVLDPATGKPRWPRALTAPTDGTAYEIVGNRYFLVSRDRLLVADLETGDTTGLAGLAFKDGEHADEMFSMGDGLIVFSRQNLFRLDAQGAVRYQRYYQAPGASFFEVLGGVSPGAVFGAAALTDEYAYFVTKQPDSTGRTGNSLVRVSLDDGSEAGRVWFREKSPTYWPDTPRDQLLILGDARTLIAVRFPQAPTTGVGDR